MSVRQVTSLDMASGPMGNLKPDVLAYFRLVTYNANTKLSQTIEIGSAAKHAATTSMNVGSGIICGFTGYFGTYATELDSYYKTGSSSYGKCGEMIIYVICILMI